MYPVSLSMEIVGISEAGILVHDFVRCCCDKSMSNISVVCYQTCMVCK